MLYSVLGNAFVRQLARERGLPAALDAVAAGAPPLFASQIKVILTQLEDCAHDDPTTFADAASDDEDGPEGDSNYDDDDAFVDVEMAPEAWEPELGSLQGEPLLCECYLANSVDARQWADRARRSRASFDGPRLTDGPHMVCDSSDLGTTIGSLAPGDPTWASTVAAAVNSGHPGDSMRARRSLASFDGPRLTDGPHMVCDSSELGTTIGSLAPGDPTWVATVACTAAAADGHPLTSVGAADNVRESWAGAGSGSGELEEDGGGDVDDDNDGVAASLRGLPPVPEEAQHSPSPSSNNSRIPALALSPPQLLLTGEPGSADAAAAALMTVATTPSRMNTALRASMASLGHDGGGGALSRTAGQSEELLSAEELLPQSSTAAVAQQHTSRTAAMQPVAVPQQQPSSPPHPPAKDTPASAPPAPPPPPLASSVSLSSDRAGGPLSLGLRPASGRDPASPALSRNSPAGPARVRTPPQQQQQQQQPSSRPPDATAPLAVTPHQAQLCVTAGGHSEKPAAESFSRGASPLHAISSNPPPPASSHGGSPGAPDGTDRSNSHFNNHGSGNSHSDNHSTSHDNGNNEISSSNEHFYGSTGRDSADGHPPSASNQHHDGSSPPPTTPDGAPTAGAGRDGSDGDESYADGRPLLTLSQLPHVDTHSPPPASGAAAPPGSGSRIPSRPASSERTGRQRMVSSPTHSPAF
ncbi:hypothetical protein FOA52_011882 [Chlamydomonas sp. UWO 241]|nr:hypothetical protein FOA52_011882 [Chlamydomonas sp. UWO 241]